MKTFTFWVKMKPTGKARPRFCSWGTYTPQNTREAEFIVRNAFLEAQKSKPATFPMPTKKPLGVRFVFNIARPKSATRKYPIVRPDIDNYVKLCLDALNTLAWQDDAQVIQLEAKKIYGDENMIEIEFWEI